MPKGIVKWFNNTKGYGFIVAETEGEDLFAHYSAITMGGYKTLRAGQEVTFEITKGDKGLHAVNINVINLDTDQHNVPTNTSLVGIG